MLTLAGSKGRAGSRSREQSGTPTSLLVAFSCRCALLRGVRRHCMSPDATRSCAYTAPASGTRRTTARNMHHVTTHSLLLVHRYPSAARAGMRPSASNAPRAHLRLVELAGEESARGVQAAVLVEEVGPLPPLRHPRQRRRRLALQLLLALFCTAGSQLSKPRPNCFLRQRSRTSHPWRIDQTGAQITAGHKGAMASSCGVTGHAGERQVSPHGRARAGTCCGRPSWE